MAWIFALGIIGFCIVSVGFRKLVFGLLALAVCIGVGTVVYFWHEDQLAAKEKARADAVAAHYPVCVGKDQTVAWLEAGDKCRFADNDPEIDAAFHTAK